MPISQYILLGKPVACPRPRATRQYKQGARIYMPRDYINHKKDAAIHLKYQMNIQNLDVIEDPVKVEIVFVYPRPKALKGDDKIVKATKPDIDNCIKTVFDALTDAGIWKDDNLVVSVTASKYYAPSGHKGQTEITITSPWRSTNE